MGLVLQRLVWMSGGQFCVEYAFEKTKSPTIEMSKANVLANVLGNFQCMESKSGKCATRLFNLLYQNNFITNKTTNDAYKILMKYLKILVSTFHLYKKLNNKMSPVQAS